MLTFQNNFFSIFSLRNFLKTSLFILLFFGLLNSFLVSFPLSDKVVGELKEKIVRLIDEGGKQEVFDDEFFKKTATSLNVSSSEGTTLSAIQQVMKEMAKQAHESKDLGMQVASMIYLPIQGIDALARAFNKIDKKSGSSSVDLKQLDARTAEVKRSLATFNALESVLSNVGFKGDPSKVKYDDVCSGIDEAQKIVNQGFGIIKEVEEYVKKLGSCGEDLKKVEAARNVWLAARQLSGAVIDGSLSITEAQLREIEELSFSKHLGIALVTGSAINVGFISGFMALMAKSGPLIAALGPVASFGAVAAVSFSGFGAAALAGLYTAERVNERAKGPIIEANEKALAEARATVRKVVIQLCTKLIALKYSAAALNVAIKICLQELIPAIDLHLQQKAAQQAQEDAEKQAAENKRKKEEKDQQDKLSTLEAAHKELLQKQGVHQRKVKDLNLRIAKLTRQGKGAQKELAKTIQELADAQSELTSVQNELETQKQKTDELESKVNKMHRFYEFLEEQYAREQARRNRGLASAEAVPGFKALLPAASSSGAQSAAANSSQLSTDFQATSSSAQLSTDDKPESGAQSAAVSSSQSGVHLQATSSSAQLSTDDESEDDDDYVIPELSPQDVKLNQ